MLFLSLVVTFAFSVCILRNSMWEIPKTDVLGKHINIKHTHTQPNHFWCLYTLWSKLFARVNIHFHAVSSSSELFNLCRYCDPFSTDSICCSISILANQIARPCYCYVLFDAFLFQRLLALKQARRRRLYSVHTACIHAHSSVEHDCTRRERINVMVCVGASIQPSSSSSSSSLYVFGQASLCQSVRVKRR